MSQVSHYMEDGNFLCGFIGGGMVFEAESEEDVSCPECKAVILARNRRKKRGLHTEDDED